MRKSSSTLIFIIGMGFLVLFPLKYFPAITGEESRRCSLYSLIFAPIRTGTQPAELSPELDKVNRRMWRPFHRTRFLGLPLLVLCCWHTRVCGVEWHVEENVPNPLFTFAPQRLTISRRWHQNPDSDSGSESESVFESCVAHTSHVKALNARRNDTTPMSIFWQRSVSTSFQCAVLKICELRQWVWAQQFKVLVNVNLTNGNTLYGILDPSKLKFVWGIGTLLSLKSPGYVSFLLSKYSPTNQR